MVNSAAEIQNLTLFAENRSVIVCDFSETIAAGEKMVLTGPSGCGKSSVLRAIPGGFEHWSGSITVDSLPLNPKNRSAIRKKIAFIPQEPRLPEGSVSDFFASASRWTGTKPDRFSQERASQLLDSLLLDPSVLAKETGHLSGGERQRIAVIFAVLLQRPILLADEITSALDKQSRSAVMDLIFSLPAAVISVSHDPVWISRCSRISTAFSGGSHV